MAIKTHKVTLSLDNPRVIQSGINVQSFDKQSIQISIELTKNDGFFRVPSDATIRVSLLKLARQEQKIIVDVPNTNRDSIDWVVPDYLDGYQGTVRVGVYLVSDTENVDLGYFTILSNVSDIDKMADEFVDNVFQGWEQIEADLNELNLTIAQTKLDLAEDLTQVDNTIANINAKNTQVNTLASDFTADVATKQSDVTSKYNAFDTDITEANQTIDDILALKPQFQSVIDETTGKDVVSAPEIILARGGATTLGERLEESDATLAVSTADIVTIIPNGTDDTTSIQNAWQLGKIPRLLPRKYIVTSLRPPENSRLISAGFSTVLQQKKGVATETRIVEIAESGIVFALEGITVKGNIVDDVDEQNHGIMIRSRTKMIRNIVIGDVKAIDIRGDAVYIGGVTNFNPQNVKVGNVTTDNVYRNGVSITGGNLIEIGNIYAPKCGMMGLDLESDTQGGEIKNVTVGDIYTSTIGILALYEGYPFCENVKLGKVTCLKEIGGSTPGFYGAQTIGVIFRNARHVKIDSLKIEGFDLHAIRFAKSGTDRFNEDIVIGSLVMSRCSLNDTIYNSYVDASGVKYLSINNGNAKIQSGKTFIVGNAEIGTIATIKDFECFGGVFARSLTLNASGCVVSGGNGYAGSFLYAGSKLENCDFNNDRFLSYTTGIDIINCKINWSSFKYSSGHERNSESGNVEQGSAKKIIKHDVRTPTTGNYSKGDIIYNNNPEPGAKIGWVCLESGTPGTWKGFGAIDM